MSAAATKWAKTQSLPQTEKAVLMALADAHSMASGFSEPVQKTIAADVGVTRETVNRTIVRLEELGLISKQIVAGKKGQWDRRRYILNPKNGGIVSGKKPYRRVTKDHTAPCDFHQTRHRVTQDHTSRAEYTSRARTLNVQGLRIVSGGVSQ